MRLCKFITLLVWCWSLTSDRLFVYGRKPMNAPQELAPEA